jgi:hypothetical protein
VLLGVFGGDPRATRRDRLHRDIAAAARRFNHSLRGDTRRAKDPDPMHHPSPTAGEIKQFRGDSPSGFPMAAAQMPASEHNPVDVCGNAWCPA